MVREVPAEGRSCIGHGSILNDRAVIISAPADERQPGNNRQRTTNKPRQTTINPQPAPMPADVSTNGDIKHFVLDTNVLLHNPNALYLFKDNEVVIPFDVVEELDKFKTNNDELGRNARTVIRHLDSL